MAVSRHTPKQTHWEHWTILLIHLCLNGLYCPNDAHLLEPLKKTLRLILISLTLPQAYIPKSDVNLHLTSVLPQRFPVRHSVGRIDFPSCGTCLNRKPRSLEPHKPLEPNLSKDARSTRSIVPRLIH
ncbi:hypothetical protein AVEN_143537-1 [Araneus ventricosus]|uniref:Uncharacterized protein n=1 Tax=Araneus ventricosus TaxID=182803 RepID=A0A4Y2APP4_ARAVE|nr:hypothetical protein AVEN_143537-1 [Araneus ventricosus]